MGNVFDKVGGEMDEIDGEWILSIFSLRARETIG
jgi:hypothetical protein